jgi:hypothetical protein
MRFTSRRFKRETVALVLVIASAATYLFLQDMGWAVYATLCVAYTIVIVGMAWANGKWKDYFGGGSSGIAKLVQIHIGFLLVAVLLLWLGLKLAPAMPEWLASRGGDAWSWYHVLVIALLVGVVMLEQWWIEKRQRKTETQATPISQGR